MATAHELTDVPLAPEAAFRLWTDLRRWPSFIDGFGHVDRVDEAWPEEGSKVVWRSRPGGRGAVTERVLTSHSGVEVSTHVLEERLTGTQTVRFAPTEDGSRVELILDYSLTRGGPFSGITDLLFIRRAERDSLRRTLRRFATEAAEEAALG
ncbi:MAG: SRPBCC family protein [Actinobacteria bacterium]|nr:MAG: SRPBCC family protein [Actinomycetota bacterium]